MGQTFKGSDFYQHNEIHYFVQMGWLVAGTGAGTYKLTAKGQAEGNKVIAALTAKDKLLIKYLVAGNVEADPNTLI